jgi:hypothetical protein
MGQLVEEVKQWNTPVIGAYLLWRFTQGFCDNHPKGEAPIAIYHFLAAGILTDYNMLELISDRRIHLQAYIRGFEEKKKTDLLLGLQRNISKKRQYTLEAIEIAVSTGLLVWDIEEARLYPKEIIKRPQKGNSLMSSIKTYGKKAEILGKWFSAHDISSVATYLEVVL